MSERRMFAKQIVLSDAFLDMPLSARCLYFTLGMFADDDGFVNNPKGIMRQCGATEDDMKILLVKKFLLAFDSGVIVIKHWKIHNYIQKDRYKKTKYLEERELLELDDRQIYHKKDACIQNGYIGKDRLGKVSIGKDRLVVIGQDEEQKNVIEIETTTNTKEKKFVKPSLEEIKNYCLERKNKIDAERFFDYYESKGWKVGKAPMKDWQAAIRTWERNENEGNTNNEKSNGDKFSRENGWF